MDKKQTTANLFLRDGVPEKIIIYLCGNGHKQVNCTSISRDIRATYSSTCLNIKAMQSLGLIRVTWRNGRTKKLELSEKGKQICMLIKEVRNF